LRFAFGPQRWLRPFFSHPKWPATTLRHRRLFEQLDEEEQRAVKLLAAAAH
jgi:hypothetical protein